MRHAAAALAGATLAAGIVHAETPGKPVLSVCADPTNLPYSNAAGEGFENHIAALLAADLHAELRTTWLQERRGFFRKTLFAGACDVVISVPESLPAAMPKLDVTRPYFVSSYAAVTRAKNPHFGGFDDAWLRTARIGLQLIGSDNANTPPSVSLARRGLIDHITGFPMWGDEGVEDPQGKIVAAVAAGTIDVAFVWGPFAGYFAKPLGSAVRVEAITADPAVPTLVYSFPMAVGVRRTDTVLRDRLQTALDRHKPEIDAMLRAYGIPLVPLPTRDQAAAKPLVASTH